MFGTVGTIRPSCAVIEVIPVIELVQVIVPTKGPFRAVMAWLDDAPPGFVNPAGYRVLLSCSHETRVVARPHEFANCGVRCQECPR